MSLESKEISGDEGKELVAAPEVTSVARSIVEGEINMQVATAKKYPRSLATFKRRLVEMVRLNRQVAESCFYVLPRAGRRLTGPSIRLAEMAVSCFGNCRVAARIVDTTPTDVTLEGVAVDMETNSAWYVQTKRRLTKSDGTPYNDDMVVTTTNAGISVVARNAALRMIPRALIDEALTSAKAVVAGEIKDITTSRKAALKECGNMGLSKERVFAFLEVEGEEDITVNHLLDLSGALNAVQDGQASVTELFPEVSTGKSDTPGRRKFGKHAIKTPKTDEKTGEKKDDTKAEPAASASSETKTAPDPNRPEKMSPNVKRAFWDKADEICGSHSRALLPVQEAIVKLRKAGKLPVDVLGWQDVTDGQSDTVLAAIEKKVS